MTRVTSIEQVGGPHRYEVGFVILLLDSMVKGKIEVIMRPELPLTLELAEKIVRENAAVLLLAAAAKRSTVN